MGNALGGPFLDPFKSLLVPGPCSAPWVPIGPYWSRWDPIGTIGPSWPPLGPVDPWPLLEFMCPMALISSCWGLQVLWGSSGPVGAQAQTKDQSNK